MIEQYCEVHLLVVLLHGNALGLKIPLSREPSLAIRTDIVPRPYFLRFAVFVCIGNIYIFLVFRYRLHR
jgi:hypothetical protein